jgi:hypothetical protein
MKKLLLLSIIILLTSFKTFTSDSILNFEYELKYTIQKKECSVFTSKSNPNDYLIHYKENNFYTLFYNNQLFNISFYDSGEINYQRSSAQNTIPKEKLNLLTETKETKMINNLLCHKYVANLSQFKSRQIEVFISKNNKINNVNFLQIYGLKNNINTKGLVMEMVPSEFFSLIETKPVKKALKIDVNKLKSLVEKRDHNSTNEVQTTVDN